MDHVPGIDATARRLEKIGAGVDHPSPAGLRDRRPAVLVV